MLSGDREISGVVESVDVMRTQLRTGQGVVVVLPNKMVADMVRFLHNRMSLCNACTPMVKLVHVCRNPIDLRRGPGVGRRRAALYYALQSKPSLHDTSPVTSGDLQPNTLQMICSLALTAISPLPSQVIYNRSRSTIEAAHTHHPRPAVAGAAVIAPVQRVLTFLVKVGCLYVIYMYGALQCLCVRECLFACVERGVGVPAIGAARAGPPGQGGRAHSV